MEKLSHSYPVSFISRKAKGKAHSILEGFDFVRFETIKMIDADLQYPPEALPEMCAQLHRGLDIVVANRVERETSLARRILSRGFALVFSKFLHGFDVDVQSGMKVFRGAHAREVKIAPDPWTFDLEFSSRREISGKGNRRTFDYILPNESRGIENCVLEGDS